MTKLIALTAALLIALTGCTLPEETAGDKKLAAPTAEETTEAVEVPKEPEYAAPAAKDFALKVKTLSKECFGSAGCNVTFRVDLAYGGPGLDPDKTYEVTYELRGGEDEMISTIEVSGDSYTHEDEQMIGTKSSKAKLKAVITDISEV